MSKRFLTGASFAGNITVTGTTFLDGLVTIDHNLNIQNNGVLKIAGTEVISATRAINAASATFAGNVGIGLTSPNRLLHIDNTSNATKASGYFYTNAQHTGVDTQAHVSIYSDHASSTGDVLHVRGDGTGNLLTLNKGGTDKLVVDDDGNATFAGDLEVAGGTQIDGNLGVGTAPTTRQLSVFRSTAGSIANFLHYTNNTTFQGLYIQVSQSTNDVIFQSSGSGAGGFKFYAGNAEKAGIDANGNATFSGTISSKDISIKQADDSGFNGGLTIERSANTQKVHIGMDGGAVNFNSPDGLSYKFRNNGTEKFTVNGSGNVSLNGGLLGLGNASSTPNISYGMFHYSGVGLGIYSSASGAAQGIGFWLNNSSAYEAGRWLSNGNLGIGTVSPENILTLQAAAGSMHQRFKESSTTIGFIGGANGIISGHNGKLALRAESGLVLSSQGNSADVVISSGNATFTGSATASSFIKSGGTSSQYLMADGSVSTTTSSFNGGTITNNLTISNSSPALNLTDTDNSSNIAFSSIGGALIVNSASDQVYQIGGAEKMRLNSSGNLGIGTTSPSVKLDVSGSIAAFGDDKSVVVKSANGTINATMGAASSSAVTTGAITVRHGGTSKIVLNANDNSYFNNGNVGIGTTSPAAKLDVQGTDALLMLRTSSGLATYIENDGGYPFMALYQVGAGARVLLNTNGNSYLNGGNVGIGTTTPGDKLNIHNSSANANLGIKITRGSQTHGLRLGVNDSHAFLWTDQNQDLAFATNNTQRLTIAAGGKVGIGTTSPSAPLVVAGTGVGGNGTIGVQGANAHVGFKNSSGTFRSWVGHFNAAGHGSDADLNLKTGYGSVGNIRFTADGDTTAAQMFLQGSTGNVGIGTTSPGAKLDVNGELYARSIIQAYAGAGNPIGGISWTSTDSGFLFAKTANVTKVLLNSNGNSYLNGGSLGIGTTAPSSDLHILGISNDTVSQANANLNVEGQGGNGIVVGTIASSPFSTYIQSGFVDNFSTAVYPISLNPSGGNVGIGTSSPSKKLHVYNTAAADVALFESTQVFSTLAFKSSTNSSTVTIGIDGAGNAAFENKLSSGNMTFVTNGSERMRIDSSGKVGIGTTTPSSPLEIFQGGSGKVTLLQLARPNNPGLQSNIKFTVADIMVGQIQHEYAASNLNHMSFTLRAVDGSDIIPLWLQNSGNVGIGETNPASKLVVRKDALAGRGGEISIVNYASGGSSGIGNEAALNFGLENSTYHGDAGNAQIKAITTAANNKSDMVFSTWNGGAFGERMRIESSGNFGIGTTTPGHLLDVNGRGAFGGTGSFRTFVSGSGAGSFIEFGTNADNDSLGALGTFASAFIFTTNQGLGFKWQQGGSDKMRLTSGGNLGIGTTSPDRTLDVEGTGMAIFGTGDYTELMLRGQVEGTGTVRNVGAFHWSVRGDVGGDNDDLKLLRFVTGTYSGIAMQIQNSTGNVGFGTDSPSGKLHVKHNDTQLILETPNSTNDIDFRFKENGSNRWNMRFQNSGNHLQFLNQISGNTVQMHLDANGQVGIGTTTIPNPFSGAYSNILQVGTTSGHTRLAITSGDTKSCDLTFADSNDATNAGSTIGSISYKHDLNAMLFSTNGSERIRIDSSGNVQVKGPAIGTTQADGDYIAKLYTASADGFLELFTGEGTPISRVKISSFGNSYFAGAGTGRVGIGTTSPGTKLEVYGNVQNDTTSIANSAAYIRGADVGVAIGQSASSPYGTWIQSQRSSDGVTFPLALNPSGSNVGIGTTSPANKLFVTSNTAGDYTGFIENTNSTNGYGLLSRTANTGTSSYAFAARAGSSDVFVVRADGNVGIGTTSPNHKLDIQVDSNVALRLHRFNSALDTTEPIGIGFSHRGDTANSTTDTRAGIFSSYNGDLFFSVDQGGRVDDDPIADAAMFIDGAAGNVGIGTITPSDLLTVTNSSTGDAALRLQTTTGGDPTIYFNSSAANRSGLIKYQDNGTNVGRIEYVHNGDKLQFQAGSATGQILELTNSTATFGGKVTINDQLFANATGNNAHILTNQSNNGTVLLLKSTGDNRILTLQSDHIFSNGSIFIGDGSHATNFRGASYTFASPGNATFEENLTAKKLTSTDGVLDLDDNGNADGVINARASLTINIDSDANSTGEVFRINSNTTSANTNNLFNIKETGKVGIGTANAQNAELVIKSGSNVDLELFSEASGTAWQSFNRTTSAWGYLRFLAGGGEQMRVHTNGNVGIGTTNPSGKLDVVGTGTASVPTVDVTCTSSGQFNHAINAFAPNLTAGENNLIVVGKAGSTKNAGYIGYKYSSAGSNNNLLTFGHWASDNLMNLTGDGKLGIGNTSPSQKLHVTGSILASSDVVAFSDIKLKENIKTLDGSKVYNMRGVSFTRKDTGKDSSGVIAQEIQKIAPELVTDNDGTLSVAYGNLTGYLIEAVKELKAEIEELKKQIK